MTSDVENKAIDFVMNYLREKGENPIDRSKNNMGFDIESGNKRIEVKGRSGKSVSIVHFNQYNFASMQKAIGNDTDYFVYIVKINEDDSKQLKIMDTTEILKKLKVRQGYDIRLTVDDFK